MSIHVLDASAMIAYLASEVGGSIVKTLLFSPTELCYAHTINLCEVYYDAVRKTDVGRARQTIQVLFDDGVIERRDLNTQYWQRVGEHKARGGISLPDCFCIVLAQELSAEVVTTDHREFDPIAARGIVPIKFIR